jgi:copper chaperone CopZ
MGSKTFEVPSISCGHCVMSIQRELGELAGVVSVEASAETKQVKVEWESPATWEGIKSLLAEINYPVAE